MPGLPSLALLCLSAAWEADVDELGGVNLLQSNLRASVGAPKPPFDPLTRLERETGLYCRFGGQLPWWRSFQDADRPKLALGCSTKDSICEELAQAAQKSCAGVTIAEEECVMGIERDVSVGLLEHMSDDDRLANPCLRLQHSLGSAFETMCWGNDRSCGAVMKVQEDPESGEVHCAATCRAAGMVCVNTYNDVRRNCGRYWEPKYAKTCESNVGHRGICECAVGEEDAPLKGDSFYFYGHKLLCEDFVKAGGGALLQVKTNRTAAL